MGVGSIMPTLQKQYLDDNGELVGSNPKIEKTYLHSDTGDELDHTGNIKEVRNEPSDYVGGFLKSIFGGEAANAGMRGGMGYLKGALLDIPESLYNTAKGAYNLVTNPKETISNIPSDIRNMISTAKTRFSEAGSNPEAFGEMMGQLTGQPAVMAELPNIVPKAIKGSAPAVEATGRFINNHAPVTRSVPFLRYGIPFSKDIEKFAGRGIEALGNKMRGSTSIQPDLVPNISGYKAGVDLSANDVLDFGPSDIQRDMPNTSGYNPHVLLDENAPTIRKSILTNEDVKDLPKEGNISGYKVIRNERPLSDIATEFLSKKKKVRMNSDGTFTDMSTGEMFDKKGNSIIEINGKSPEKFQSPDRNSSFFFKNRS
jgi:hypothetical protein